jgi:signal transduction histidine kinase
LDLSRLAEDAVHAIQTSATVRGVILTIDPGEEVPIFGDPTRLHQLLGNLLSNAIKFSPPASTVTVEIEANSDSLFLKVVDRGRGIPADKLETVFDRFQQVEHTDASKKGGTGLGLAICRSIVQQHGGAIWAQSNLSPTESHHTALPPSHNGVHTTHAGRGTTLWVQFMRIARATDAIAPLHLDTPAQRGEALIPDRGEGLIAARDHNPGIRAYAAEQ